MQFSSIEPIDRALSDATILHQCGPGSNDNEGVLRIPQGSSITGTSPSDCLVSYSGHSLEGGSYPSVEKQLVYSTTPADWANNRKGRAFKCQKFGHHNEICRGLQVCVEHDPDHIENECKNMKCANCHEEYLAFSKIWNLKEKEIM